MALPADVREQSEAHLDLFCRNQVPEDLHDELRVEYKARGNALTIFERRPPWREDMGPEWSSTEVAQLRYDPTRLTWTLYWKRANGRWDPYGEPSPSRDVGPLLAVVADDPDGCFWG